MENDAVTRMPFVSYNSELSFLYSVDNKNHIDTSSFLSYSVYR